MTDLFPDPFQELMDQDPTILRDPDPVLPPEPQSGGSVVLAAIGLSAAYLVYRNYMKAEMEKRVRKLGGDVSRQTLLAAASLTYNAFVPRWISLTAPYLIAGYMEGIRATETGDVPQELLEKIARDYALELGNHINNVSAESMVSGYQAQVNRKVPPALAARRVADAYGVTKRGMNALVNVWTSEEPKRLTDQPLPSTKEERTKVLIEAQHQLRAKQIGDNEAWTARTQAKQIVWMYGAERGVIPSSARRVWITAADERVCAVCGPMDGVEAKVGEKFTTSEGELWTPPSHINCRCDVVLDFNITEDVEEKFKTLLSEESVSKARGSDRYDRDNNGRFARQEQRTSRIQPQYKERDANLDAMLAQVNEALNRPVETPAKPSFAKPKLTPRPQLGRPQIARLNRESPIQRGLQREGLKRELRRQRPKVGISRELERAIADNPITREKIQTSQGGWEPLDHPLVMIRGQYDSPASEHGEDVYAFIDEDEAWYEMDPHESGPDKYERALAHALGEHWNEFIDHMMDRYYDEPNEGKNYFNPEDGMNYHVDEDTYYEVLVGAVGNLPKDQANTLLLHGYGEFADHAVRVSAYDIANQMGIFDMIEDEEPHLLVARHGMPGVTQPINGSREMYSNPGKWRVIGEELVGASGYSPYSYKVFYVEPEDLLDD